MTEKDFSIGGKQFKLSKIDALKQFHIVRRIGPILSDLLPAITSSKKLHSESEKDKLEALANIATPVMNGLSKLSDVDSELVLYGLLNAVEMKTQFETWAKVAANNMLMVQDLELPVLLQLAGRAFAYNLSGFFAALPAK